MNLTKRVIASATTAVALTLGAVAVTGVSAEASQLQTVKAVKDDGPGLKNWHCRDSGVRPYWYGPWRYTKAGADIDCASYLVRRD